MKTPPAVIAGGVFALARTRARRGTSGFTLTGCGGSLAVKYADYMIYGNVIILCQGRDSEQSLRRCTQLVETAIGN